MSETSSPRKRRLGRLEARKRVIGPWLPILALCFVIGGIVLDATVSAIPGLTSAAVGTILAWFGREAKWRGVATLALVLGVLLVLVFLAVLLIGRENIGELTQSIPGT